ncbi:MAG: succinate dehydrogenase [Bacteroidetes bacterium]|nr:MAG: succinate dehydrogenase [Bacteroidota bacterium]MBL1143506.1 succinate dehydrogenase [Bacteroidota bacterium]MCB0802714.1 succinate dehydrogenase cytochrome b subunit [Flavobacteriales bacterium]NOG56309.1 succinate dehydrogenase cytochrome b subunit [Bacteroidota bacterium]
MENSKTSIFKKVLMALSGLFLLIFLLQHFIINFLSVINPDAFNDVSHFMGTNPLIQFIMQPILMLGVVLHLVMGVVIEQRNRAARPIKYAYNKPDKNSSWMSRNMIITGVMVILFLGLHFYDFWLPEIKTKFIDGDFSGKLAGAEGYRYFTELQHKFMSPVRIIIYCLAFVFLALHLLHGFQSAFQTVGLNHNKYTPTIKKIGNLYAVLIPLGFIFIAVFHFINASH